MATPIGCPRCHNENVVTESNNYQTPLGTLTIKKNICPNCASRWFFEEELIGIFAAAQMQRGAK